ncbi:carbamoyltransferase [Candidatus Woesearchaeota archaeon]|nr:carbamoyltransferase [Candidatus Woesearchaeota archaeon]
MNILGLSCHFHDSSAAIVGESGQVLAAVSEERFTRKKHDNSFPENAVAYCFEEAGVTPGTLDAIVFYEKPIVTLERDLYVAGRGFPGSWRWHNTALGRWLNKLLNTSHDFRKKIHGFAGDIYYPFHHQSHAAHTFFASPFEEAVILTVDGVGEWTTTAVGYGHENQVTLEKELRFPHSLGLFYSAFTHFLGFAINDAEYKVMGLAPYGEKKYVDMIKQHLIHILDDGTFRLNMNYFGHHDSLRAVKVRKFQKLFGMRLRKPGEPLTQQHKDLARSMQAVTEEVMVKLARDAQKQYGLDNLCLAGGVALNCVANSAILRESGFKNIFIPPGAGDDGGAIGAALFAYHCLMGRPRVYQPELTYLGPKYTDHEIQAALDKKGLNYQRIDDERTLTDMVSDLIIKQKVVGWFQGRMEFGARALGNRSILADPRNYENWQRVNLKIKFRESFRPFAPVVTYEEAGDYFDTTQESPYMTLVADVHKDKRSVIPATTHVDGTARLQTITQDQNSLYYRLIKHFGDKTGVPVLINTSFNRSGEPIVCEPHDAVECFLGTEMDVLVIGKYVVDKQSK